MRARTMWLFGALALGRLALGAQENPPTPAGDFGASVDVRVVNVEAVVTDGSGHLAKGLKAADFRLLVDGREVAIDYFTEVSDGEEVASRPAAEPPTPAVKVATSYLIFIDNWYSIDTERNRVLSRLAQELSLGPEDRAAIVVYDGRPAMLSGWTGDIDSVRKILGQVERSPVRRAPMVWDPQGVEVAAAAATVAMRGMPSRPGRKLFLLISSGWPTLVTHSEVPVAGLSAFSDVPLEKLFEPVADTANLLGYTIYFLEIPGSASDNFEPYQNLWHLARRTGGQAVLYSPRLSAFGRVEKDTRSYYSMAFSPAWRSDGTRHRIQLTVRRPGLGVRARDGFFDMSPRLQATLKAENRLLFGHATPIKVEAGEPRRSGLGTIELPVTLAIPAGVLTPQPLKGAYELRATVFADSRDEWGGGGRLLEVPLHLTLPSAPRPGEITLFKVTVKLNTLKQRLVFSVEGDGGHGLGRGGLDWPPRIEKDRVP